MFDQIYSSDKKHALHHSFFEPTQSDVRATLLIVHGMSEHGGRYKDFAKYLANNGLAVLTYDQLGHGHSVNNPDELGYFTKDYPAQTLQKDVVIMANQLKERHPNVPHFIMGHSMGSFIVRNVLQVHNSEFAGAIIMGTSNTDPLIKPLLPITKALNKVQPKLPNSVYAAITNRLMNFKLNDKTASSQYAWLVNDKDSLAAYEADPLCGFNFTNNGYWALFNLMATGLGKDWAETIEKDFPMLFVSGEDDPLGDMGKGIRKLTHRLQQDGYSHIEQLLYPEMRHEPLHEKDHKIVYEDLFDWMMTTITLVDKPNQNS